MCRFAGEGYLQRRKKRKYITMNFYNHIFCSAYTFYKESNSGSPRYSASCIVTASQILFFLIILIVLKVFGITDFIETLNSKYIFIPIILVWIFIVHYFYSKERTQNFLRKFELLSDRKKEVWGIISVFSIVLPFIVIMIFALK